MGSISSDYRRACVPDEGRRRDLRPYRGPRPAPTIGSVLTVDLASFLLVLVGLGLAVALAIVAGTACARVLFAATRQHPDPPAAAVKPD